MKKILLLLTLHFSLFGNAQDFWTEATPFGSGSYYAADISIVDESTVWVTGTDFGGPGTWRPWLWGRSIDGGLTWTSGVLPDEVAWPTPSDQYISNICALSDQTAYVGAVISANSDPTTNKLLVTHDAGNT